jgi:predicted Rossmann fold flavoprotein
MEIYSNKKHSKQLAVIGAGAAGYFGALSAAAHFPDWQITIFEKNRTTLNKVRISGGGRCNVTHACFDDKKLATFYPRGGTFLRKLFAHFNTQNTVEWFESRGVELKTESDGRMFPTTDLSETIIACLENEIKKYQIQIYISSNVSQIEVTPSGTFSLKINDTIAEFDRVLVTTGGHPQLTGYDWLHTLGHEIVPPVPSLFTFNVPDSPFHALAGISVNEAVTKISGQKTKQSGPLLLTHWGFSGPAVLKLSAWAARELAECGYQFSFMINWNQQLSENSIQATFTQYQQTHTKRQIQSHPLFEIPSRLWALLCELSGISATLRWHEVSGKSRNRLTQLLLNASFEVKGKTTFKEEFVTAGGIALSQVNPDTLESRQVKGLFFAGEILDIDALTGGFNFQAAWTTSFVAGKYIGL